MADVRIVPYEVDKHLEPILELMRNWSPDHPELAEPSLYAWQHCKRFVALHEDRVVGQICQIAHEYRYRDARPPAQIGWGITLVLDMSDDAIRKAAGRQLLAACENSEGLHYAAVGVVPVIEPAYLRRGHQLHRDTSAYHARFFRPEKALAYWGRSKWLAPAMHLANLFLRPNAKVRNGSLERVARFEPAWDATWDQILRARYDLSGIRTAEYLNYKLSQPRREYFTYLHRSPTREIDGYVVFRRAKHRARDLDILKICDFVAEDPALDDLLAVAMAHAYAAESRGTYGIVGLSGVEDTPAFRRAGLWVVRPYPVVVAAPVPGRIRVSFFDSDLDDLW
jgi:hypothetical protein